MQDTKIRQHPATARYMEQTLPRHLTPHDVLSAEQSAHLQDVTGRHNCAHYGQLVRAVLAQKVAGYHESEAGDWQTAARQLTAQAMPADLFAPEDAAPVLATLEAAIAGYRPAKALNILVRLAELRLVRQRAAARRLIRKADELFPRTDTATTSAAA